MIPAIFLPKLTFTEFMLFEIVHTCICFILLAIFLFSGINLLSEEGKSFRTKQTLKNTAIIVGIDSIVVLVSSFIVFLGAIMSLVGSFLFLFVDFILVFILFGEMIKSKIRCIALYIIAIIPAFIISLLFTEFIFSLMGIPDAVVFPFI